MKRVDFLLKPASSLCNMRCRYCFYVDEAARRQIPCLGRMSDAIADAVIEAAMEAVDEGGQLSFAFQGGEPTLAGLAFFERFVAQAAAKNTKGVATAFSIQTNGLAIDEAWASFLAKNHFLVGVSLDGDKTLHDEFRPDAEGRGTWLRVCRALSLLQRAGAEENLLCVVTKRCAKSPVRAYHAMQKTGARHLQFIPCLDPLDTPRGAQPWSLTPEDYAGFLCGLFDEWYRDWAAGNYTSVRQFDDYVHLAMGLPPSACAAGSGCGPSLVIEADGSIYPCDFYALDEWRLGRVGEAPLAEIFKSERAVRFAKEGLAQPAACAACPWYAMCFGGCKRDWTLAPGGEMQNYYCAAFRRFFDHAAPRLRHIARCEKQLWRDAGQAF